MLKSLTALLLSLLMLVGSLVPQNDVEELGKLPELVRHYRYHAQPAHGGLSLGEFLAQHYGPGAFSGTDPWCLGQVIKARLPLGHERLPMQGQHNLAPQVYLLPATRLVVVRPWLPAVAACYTQPAVPRYPAAHGPALLQPPRA